jgi:predicted DNA-binding transcriptional regulator YafY
MRVNKDMIRILPVLLKRLSNGQSLSTKALSKEFSIPSKTIQENIKKYFLKLYPDEIYFSRSTNTWNAKTNFLSQTLLSAQEIIATDILEEKSKEFGEEFHTFTKILFNRFRRRASYEIYKKSDTEKIHEKDEPIFATIKKAISKKQILHCTYSNKERIIYPLKIVVYDGYWYVLVYEENSQKLKTFHLKSIKITQNTNQTFTLPDTHIQEKLDGAINAHFKDKEPILVELEMHKEIAKYFHRKPLSKRQSLFSSTTEDHEVMHIYVTDYMEIIPTIQQFLPFIKVISPEDLHETIQKHAKDYDNPDLSAYFETKAD